MEVPEDSSTDDEVGSESSSSESADDICEVGVLGCACTPGGSCDPGLVCIDDVCSEPNDESETGPCTMLGCECDSSPDSCDPGLECMAGTCAVNSCGNGALDQGEQCDDGNRTEIDGCENDCSFTEILGLTAGDRHTCALIEGGTIRCWGEGFFGQLGYGVPDSVGNDELPVEIGPVGLPGAALTIHAGEAHTCARFDDGVRCWGQNYYGQLGYGNAATVQLLGDNELLDMLAIVVVGGGVVELSSGGRHGCARLDDGKIRCWGSNDSGQLGIASTLSIGDDEDPADAQEMLLGKPATRVAVGGNHSCVITNEAKVRCWGRNNSGQLGYGHNQSIGDNEAPNSAGDISLIPASLPADTPATGLALGNEHTCALLGTGDVICWGRNDQGQLATGNNQDWGEQAGETPSELLPIDLGGPAVAIAAGAKHNCALLADGNVRCWGDNGKGQLGLGSTDDVGIDLAPIEVEPVLLGGSAIAITAAGEHSCAVVEDPIAGNSVACWGTNPDGRLGYGHTLTIGDDEDPIDAGAVELW